MQSFIAHIIANKQRVQIYRCCEVVWQKSLWSQVCEAPQYEAAMHETTDGTRTPNFAHWQWQTKVYCLPTSLIYVWQKGERLESLGHSTTADKPFHLQVSTLKHKLSTPG